jgi:uncharacterized OB-fold protein
MTTQQCGACQALVGGSGGICPVCLSPDSVSAELPRHGRLLSWTTIRKAPAGYPVPAPYNVVVVDLGPGLRVVGRLAPDSPAPGMDMPVRRIGQEGACHIFSVVAG